MILEQLRRETADLHRKIEKNIDLITGVRTQADYFSLLKALYRFYVPLELTLLPYFSNEFDSFQFDSRIKSHLLREDLLHLGVSAQELTELSLAQVEDLPIITDYYSAVGCLYVLEGSSLGGQILVKQFQKQLAAQSQLGFLFYKGYGQETGTRWREFQKALGLLDDSIDQCQLVETIGAAQSTFNHLERWLQFEWSQIKGSNQSDPEAGVNYVRTRIAEN